MLKNLIQIFFLTLVISCSEKRDDSTTTSGKTKIKVVEYVYPESFDTEVEDTLIKDGNFEVSVAKIPLKTSIIEERMGKDIKKNEKKIEIINIKYIDKYRDFEIHLKVSQNSKIVLDTVFHKELFVEYLTKSEMKKSVLDFYSFHRLVDGKLIFGGVLSKPFSLRLHEDIFFYHYYDIKNKTLKTKY